MLRRNVPHLSALKKVENLDAFPKIHEEYTQATATGGTVSILSFLIIVFLVYTEICYYSSTILKFEYDVDREFDSKIKINVDITVAMPCDLIGADILDVTNQNTETFGMLHEEPTYFELSASQKVHWETMQSINKYIREEYHAIQELMWKDGYTNILRGLPSSDVIPSGQPDACRLYGSLVVNKVAGNFHITAGKHIPHPIGHAHLSAFLKDSDYNFSHRIERFSFGEQTSGIFDPLEGDEKIAPANFHIFQYYIKVVPTEVLNLNKYTQAFQYAVTEQDRPINHQAGSHGVPGIYFKYDMSFIKVKVTVEKHSPWRFLIRLCGIIGGVFATSGILNGIMKLTVDLVTCKFLKDSSASTKKSRISSSVPYISIIKNEQLYQNPEKCDDLQKGY